MKNDSQKPKKKFNSTLIGLLAIGAIVIGVIAWITPWVHLDTRPKPLGERLEFIGKFDYGCYGGLCDSPPGASYFYASDMTAKEVGQYFQKAVLVERPIKEEYSKEEGGRYRLEFSIKQDTKKGFYLIFYDNGPIQSVKNGLKTTKKHLIEVDHTYYQIARDSL